MLVFSYLPFKKLEIKSNDYFSFYVLVDSELSSIDLNSFIFDISLHFYEISYYFRGIDKMRGFFKTFFCTQSTLEMISLFKSSKKPEIQSYIFSLSVSFNLLFKFSTKF